MTNDNPSGIGHGARKPPYTAERLDDQYVPTALARVYEDRLGLRPLSYTDVDTGWAMQARAATDRRLLNASDPAAQPEPHTPWWLFWR